MFETLPTWTSGDDLKADDLNMLSRAADAALSLTVDPGTGLSLICLPHSRIIRGKRKLECWVKITSGGTSGIYAGTQQMEAAGGTWAAGPRSWTVASGLLIEANVSTTVPATTIVRAWKDRFCWRFNYS